MDFTFSLIHIFLEKMCILLVYIYGEFCSAVKTLFLQKLFSRPNFKIKFLKIKNIYYFYILKKYILKHNLATVNLYNAIDFDCACVDQENVIVELNYI